MTAARAQRIDDWVVHRPNIVRSVAARVPGIDAEEATSRALEKMVRIVSTGGTIDDPAPYWRRAAVNEAISMTREAGRARPVEDDTLDGLTPPVAGAELDAERLADVSMLRTALSDLAEDDRQILLERHVHDKAVTDIATGLGVRPHAVTMRLRRAEERLAGAFAAAHAQAVNEPECRTTRAAMHDYLKDRLLPRRRARVEAHMDGCAECTRAFIDVREVSWMLRDYGQHVVAGAIATGALGAAVGAGAAGAGAAGGGAAGAGAPRSFGKKEAAIVAGVLAALAVGGGAMALVANQPDDPPAAQSVPNPGAGSGGGGGGAGGEGAGGGGADGGDGGAGSEGTDGDGAGGDGAGGAGAGGDGAGGDGAGGAGGAGAGGAGAEGTGEGDSGGGSAGEGAGGSGESVDSEGANDGAGGGGRGDGGSDAGSEDAGARGDVGGEDASGGTDSEGTGREGTDGDDAGREGDGGTIVGGSDGDGEPETTDESDGDGQPEGQPDAEGENGGANGDGSSITDDTTSGVGAGIKDWLATLGIGDGTPSEGSGSGAPPGTGPADGGDASNGSDGGNQPDDGGASDESDGGSPLNDDDSDGTNSGVGAGIKDWLATLGIGDGTPSDAEGEDDTGTSSGTETGVGTDGTEPGTTDGASRGSDGPAAADGTDTGIGAEMTSWLGRLGAIGIPGFLLIVVILWLWERWSRPEDG